MIHSQASSRPTWLGTWALINLKMLLLPILTLTRTGLLHWHNWAQVQRLGVYFQVQAHGSSSAVSTHLLCIKFARDKHLPSQVKPVYCRAVQALDSSPKQATAAAFNTDISGFPCHPVEHSCTSLSCFKFSKLISAIWWQKAMRRVFFFTVTGTVPVA